MLRGMLAARGACAFSGSCAKRRTSRDAAALNSSGIGEDRQDRRAEDQIAGAFGHQALLDAEIGEDEGELADLRQARADEERRRQRIAEQPDQR